MRFSRFFGNYDRLLVFTVVMVALIICFRYHAVMPFLLLAWVIGCFYLTGGFHINDDDDM